MFYRIFKSLCFLFCITSSALAATGNLFVVTSTGTGNNVSITLCLNVNGKNPLSCQNYTTSAGTLTLSTTVPNKTYKYAGIRINTPGYIFTRAGLKKNIVSLVTGTTSTGVATDFIALPLLSPAPTTMGSVTPTTRAAPSITSSNSTSFAYNTSSSFTVTTTGLPVPTLSYTGTLPTGVTFTDNGNGTATIAGTPTASPATYNMTITASNGILPDATQPLTLTVTKANQTITATASPNPVVFGNTSALSSSGFSGTGAVTYAVTGGGTGTCSITDTTLSSTVAGTCLVTATIAADANYNAATSTAITVTVNKASQTVDFTSPAPSATVGGATYTPAATSTSGLTVAITVDASSSAICSISDGVVSFTAAGTCTLNANQAGNANYTAADQEQQFITVHPAPFTVTTVYSSQNPSITGALITLSANVSSGSGVPTGTVSFASNGTTIAGCDAATLTTGTATCSISTLSAGTQSIVATYTPATNAFSASTSATFNQYVVATLNPSGGTVVPAAPTQVLAVPGDAQVTVSWFPPTNTGGNTINKYQVSCYINSSGSAVPAVTTSSLTQSITGLTNGTAYYCTVAASSNDGTNYGPLAYSTVVTPTSGLSASPANLALSVKNTSLNAALTGNPRTITLTNTSGATINGINIAIPVDWTGSTKPSAYSTCGSSLNPASSCTIIVTPGTAATSTCTTGGVPTPDTITVTSSSDTNPTIGVVVLGYACQYQGGYVFSVNDTTIPIGSISGTVATTADQGAGVFWSADGAGSINYTSIWGIDELSTIAVPDPNASSQYAATIVTGQLNCNGNTDGSCDTNNIYTQYSSVTKTYYATGLCKQPLNSSGAVCTVGSNCYSDWYLPSICEMGSGSGCGIQNMQTNLVDTNTVSIAGLYWSSTEYSGLPQRLAWIQDFASSGGSGQYRYDKGFQLGVRCSRALTI